MKVIVLFIALLCSINSTYSQSLASDINLIGAKDYSINTGDNNFRNGKPVNNKLPIAYKHKSFVAKYNPFSLLASGAMLFYQNVVSVQFFRHCLYERSCSNYSKQAINEFGLIKGVFMSADRLMRCNGMAINDIPPDQFDNQQLAIDEPSKYHWKKK